MNWKVIPLSAAITATAYIQPLIAGGSFTREAHLIIVSGSIILAIYLVWFISLLDLRRRDAYILTGFTLFTAGGLNNILEAYFFTEKLTDTWTLIAAITFSLMIALIRAAFTILIIRPEGGMTLKSAISGHIRSARSYPLRIAATSLAYLPVYFAFGLIVSPFVAPIYTNPQSGLSVPSLSLLVPLEITRGAIYAVVLTAVFASLRKQKEQKNLSFKAAAALLFIPGGFLPLLSSLDQVSVLSQVAPYHSLELLADSIVYGYIASRILANGKMSGNKGEYISDRQLSQDPPMHEGSRN
jgi:hypothetical protein